MNFSSVRDAAEQYIALGFRVVPLYGMLGSACSCGYADCKPRDHGKHADAETEARWKDGEPFTPEEFRLGDNIAIAMGPWGGSPDWLVALDIDGELDLKDHFYEPLPETLWQKTPRGRHLIFRVVEFAPLGNWVDVLSTKPGPSLDLRYARGRIVAAPSRGATGAYEWGPFREPAELPYSVMDQIFERRRERGLPVLDTWERGKKRP